MSTFAPQVTIPVTAPPDPTKHVNYTLGMVLGVDDFTQEFAYLSGRDQWLARDRVGYGTVCGLRVTSDSGDKGPRVSIDPGNAVNPRGQLISVPSAQCAYLNDWLAVNKQTLVQRLTSPPQDTLTLYITLCYRECPTDPVPIAGEPCRSEDESMAPSRLKDDYRLELRFDPPDQREEDSLRQFVVWLHQWQVTDAPGTFITLDDFQTAVRGALNPSSPPLVADGSPPQGPHIHTADACLYLRTAFRIWTTELRPVSLGQTCAGAAPDEECVMLAALHVPIARTLQSNWVVDDTRAVSVDEEQRPFLIHLRLLQEYLICGLHQGGAPDTTVQPADAVTPETAFGLAANAGTSTEYSRADHTHGSPTLPELLAVPVAGETVTPETAFGLAANTGTSSDYSRADHTHGSPTLPLLGGDATGDLGSVTVERLRNVPVAAAAPEQEQVLTFREGTWQPANLPPASAVPAPGSTVTPETAFGLAANAGALAEYSRADHTHGTPPPPDMPAPGNTVTVETSFGQAAHSGASVLYSRVDHSHGTPPAAALANDYVGHPSGKGSYMIVAAGIVRDNGSRPPVYNSLAVRVIGDGQVAVTFDGYVQPGGPFQYIIKAMPVFNASVAEQLKLRMPLVTFDRFEPNRCVLFVTDNGRPIPQGQLASLEVMIEVSQFFRG
jgi:hypothetical protein